jgi:hypothetical protein
VIVTVSVEGEMGEGVIVIVFVEVTIVGWELHEGVMVSVYVSTMVISDPSELTDGVKVSVLVSVT